MELKPEGAGRALHVSGSGVGLSGIGRVDEQGHDTRRGRAALLRGGGRVFFVGQRMRRRSITSRCKTTSRIDLYFILITTKGVPPRILIPWSLDCRPTGDLSGDSAGMDNFWMGIAAAQNAVAGTEPANRRHRVLSIVGGIALTLLIGAGLFIVAALNS